MKTRFAEPTRRYPWLRLGMGVLAPLFLAPIPLRATDPAYINFGNVTVAPQIDATNFINYGSFNILTLLPFETSNTRNFTNYGSLIGAAGWYFDNVPATNGVRQLADNIFNANSGVIQGVDTPAPVVIGFPNQSGVAPSYLWAQATNIVNQGLLQVGANGWLRLIGTNINISRGGLEVAAIEPIGTGVIGTNYLPDAGIYDIWWGGTNTTFDSSIIWDGTFATAPPHFVQEQGGLAGNVSFTIQPSAADSYAVTNVAYTLMITNIVGITNQGPPTITNVGPNNVVITNIIFPSNVVHQAAFVSVSDPQNMGVGFTWEDSSSVTNPMKTVGIEIAMVTTNLVSASPELLELFFYDTLASETNRGMLANIETSSGDPSRRPANYWLSRLPLVFGGPNPDNGVPTNNFLWDANTYSNAVVTGEYTGYRAFVDNLISEPPAIPAGTVTNLPGRIQIVADSLDMTRTRFRGEGEMTVKARHLVGSSNAVVDCQNLSFDLASTNGHLNLVNLAKESVARLKGDIIAWSGLWSNTVTEIYTNNWLLTNVVDTNNMVIGTNAVQAPITNVYQVNLHALILDGDALLDKLPVTVWDLNTHSTNAVLNDNMTVVESLFTDAQSWTINGRLTLSQASWTTSIGTIFSVSLPDFTYTNAPNLLYFTNNGTLAVPNNAHFGDDRPIPYSAFVNTGTINAASIHLDSQYFQNSGSMAASVQLNFQGGAGKLEGGNSTSAGDTVFNCSSVKFNQYQLTCTGGALNFNVSDALFDAGGSSSNQFSVLQGFNLPSKPRLGDLLGTTIQSQTPPWVEVDHTWAGEDHGVNAVGYSNNVAIGVLQLGPMGSGSPLLYFRGAGAQNGLYVDMLDLTSLGTNYQNFLAIDPSLTIYYAAAKLAFTPPKNSSGVDQEPEEYLDGQFGGRLRWVSSFAGPNSSVDVIINGITVQVNRALRYSKIIDSNGNGIPNFYDLDPFGGPTLTAALATNNPPPARAVLISWGAVANGAYRVEFKDGLDSANWQLLQMFTNNAPTNRFVTIWDTNAPSGAPQRYYRVGLAQ